MILDVYTQLSGWECFCLALLTGVFYWTFYESEIYGKFWLWATVFFGGVMTTHIGHALVAWIIQVVWVA